MKMITQSHHIALPFAKMIILISWDDNSDLRIQRLKNLFSHDQNVSEENWEEKITGEPTTNKFIKIVEADTFPKMRSLVNV